MTDQNCDVIQSDKALFRCRRGTGRQITKAAVAVFVARSRRNQYHDSIRKSVRKLVAQPLYSCWDSLFKAAQLSISLETSCNRQKALFMIVIYELTINLPVALVHTVVC